ncbi:MAG: ATP-binding protein [Flavobacteriaceae bacterium]
MNFSKNSKIIRVILVTLSFIVVSIILWNTYDFFQKFKEEERNKVILLGDAQKNLVSKPLTDTDFDLALKIVNNNKTIPIIQTDENGVITGKINLDTLKEHDPVYLKKQLEIMKKQNEPIKVTWFIMDSIPLKNTIDVKNNKKRWQVKRINYTRFQYYRDSDLLTKLKYYPLALLLILTLFGSVVYLVFKSTRVAEQNKLWAGMAKETAHQIGTPLTSLLGWVEILRMDNTEETTVVEIEKDITRLNTIADRFSKIGSIPKLERINLVDETKKSFTYLESRSSKQVHFSFSTDIENTTIMANKQLFSWVIENVIKNAIDAMQGKGKLDLAIKTDANFVKILISDSGKGISKANYKKIFETGFTTKKRGWGLGLSLAKRIINDYHNGKIYVKKSTLGKGTCIAISLKKV